MSSALQSTLTSLQFNDYVSLAVLTAIGYDYILTLSDEIEYIWAKPWTRVSTLFILVRYAGLSAVVTSALLDDDGIHSWEQDFAWLCGGQVIFSVQSWMALLFLGSADLVMILRVWAMYNRSRLILIILLVFFSIEMISTTAVTVVYSKARKLGATAIQILDVSICVWQAPFLVLTIVVSALQVAHAAVLCILAIAQFVRQSLQMYRVTKQWQVNQFMNLLVEQGILYFLAIFLFGVIDILNASVTASAAGWRVVLFGILEYVPVYTLSPRFVMSMRKIYARDVHGKRGSGIDTGFGLSSSRGAVGTVNAIVFADNERNEGLAGIEEVPREGEPTEKE